MRCCSCDRVTGEKVVLEACIGVRSGRQPGGGVRIDRAGDVRATGGTSKGTLIWTTA